MPNATARTLLICSVPVFVALFSVYWFRKKKKYKTLSPQPAVYEKVDSLAECSLDSADTLSDASSFTSPESSEKSLRTKSFINNIVVKNNDFCNSTPQSNPVERNSFKTSPSLKFESPEFQASNLHNIKTSDSDSDNNKSDVGFSAYEGNITSDLAEKCNLLPTLLASLGEVTNEDEKNTTEGESTEEIFSRLLKKSEYNSKNPMETLEDMLGLIPNNLHNGISHDSIENGDSPMELETSNDSRSSVLEENSMSYSSDDSEKLVTESRNKSILSDYDESLTGSLCEESANSPILSAASLKLHSSFNPRVSGDSIDKEASLNPKLEGSPLNLSAVNLDLNECSISNDTVQVNCITDSDTEPSSSIPEQNCSAMGQIDSFSETPDSCDSSAIKPSCVISPIVKSKSSNHEIYGVLTASPSPATEGLATVKDAKSPAAEAQVNGEEAESSAAETLLVGASSPAAVETLVKEEAQTSEAETLVNGEEKTSAAAATQLVNGAEGVKAAEDPQIPEMDISEHLNRKALSSSEGMENSSSESGWEMQDSQSDALSQSKSDETGLAGSKVPENSSGQFVYEFELPQELCGRLIGKQGKHVKSIKDRSHANVYIKRHPFDPQLKTVVVEGARADVTDALDIIRRKYPPTRFPAVTLVKTNMASSTNVLPESLQLHIPEGASCDVILSSLVSAGHFFLQQPTHPTYPSLSTLDQCMGGCYSPPHDTPLLPHPVEAGVICAAPVLSGWYRAQVVYVYENEVECELKFVDYGGFSQAQTASLRQIRSDFMSLPFQASECYLANVRPVDPVEGWSAEATSTFEELAQGQILQALLVGYAQDGIPCVQLYRVQGISNMFINKELVERGLAVWVNSSHWDPH